MRSGFCDVCEGQALALRLRRRAARATVVRGGCLPRPLPHPVHPVNPGDPASDVIDIKVLTDLFSLLRLRSIDIQVLSDLFLPHPVHPINPGHPASDDSY